MRLNPRFLQDTLTLELETDGPRNPLTHAPTGDATVQLLVTQMCSDQDITLRQRSQMIESGVAGSLPVSRAYTTWFPWPDVPDGSRLIVRVNGQLRPLLKQGPPSDLGGQHQVYQLELGPPEQGR